MAKSDQKKAQALAALMECDTFTEAAEKAGISRKTLYNYMTEDEEFAKVHRAMQERRTLERADMAEANYSEAIRAVVDIMHNEEAPFAIRLKSAIYLMEAATKELSRSGELAQKNKERTNPLTSAFNDMFDL